MGDPRPRRGEKSAPAAPPVGATDTAKGAVAVTELTRLQQTVARRMAESKATAPHFYLQAEIDMAGCVAARSQDQGRRGDGEIAPSFNDMVVKAVAIALREFPRANGAYRDGRFELYRTDQRRHRGRGPRRARRPDDLRRRPQGRSPRSLSNREPWRPRCATARSPRPSLAGGTFTVSNLGMYGVTNFHPVINTPQAAILAVGAIREEPVAKAGEVSVAPMMGATLACDHRIVNGADGAAFLARVGSLLEEPIRLAL